MRNFDIPQGQTREDVRQRKKIIKDFYAIWNAEYDKKDVGIIKLTVGVLKGSGQHVQYCITAIEKTTA